MLQRLYHYLRLCHPVNGLASAAAVLAGYWITLRFHGLVFEGSVGLLAMLATFMISSAGFIINDILDMPIDLMNRPDRPLPAGDIYPATAWRLYGITTLIGLLCALLISPLLLAFTALIATLLYVYSRHAKGVIVVGHVLVAFSGGVLLLYGGLIAGQMYPMIWTLPAVFLAFFGREILKTIPDVSGDGQFGINNLATRYGTQAASLIAKTLFAISFIAYSALAGLFNTLFVVSIVLLALPLTAALIWQIQPDKNIRQSIATSKFVFLVMVVIIVVGTM